MDTMTTPERIVLFFIDGLGWGAADDAVNPTRAWARPIDACLGVAGLPQSAAGQTTPPTGVNAAARPFSMASASRSLLDTLL